MADRRTLVDELAQLAQLELEDDEAEALAGQLERVLGYMQGLMRVDVEGVPEHHGADQVRSGLRDDDAEPDAEPDALLEAVPDRRDRLVAVPKFMVEGGKG